MQASMVELRYKTREVIKSLERNESVILLYHGKVKGIISPARQATPSKGKKVRDHPFFASTKRAQCSVDEQMAMLRGLRHRDL